MKIFKEADILIPQNIDFAKWSVVACDQYTSQPEYWTEVKGFVDDAPSTLNLTFPEIYLNEPNREKRIKNINAAMQQYIDDGIFKEYKNSYIYVERTQPDGRVRKGIVGGIDLEYYDYSKGAQTPVRATEGTILSRIPPRQKIRENAPLELPHIIMLIDDRKRAVVEPLEAKKDNFEKVYDFELMQDSGHLRGYRITPEAAEAVNAALEELSDIKLFEEKYGINNRGLLEFAVGDGNHSLATAKSCWEEIKRSLSEDERENHPARYALVEIENIHDEALEFEPIHRVLFEVEPEKLMSELEKFYDGFSYEDNGGQKIDYVYAEKSGSIYIQNAPANLSTGTLQNFIDYYMQKNGGRVDYIHGKDVVRSLSKAECTIGFMLGEMKKEELFTSIIKDGTLPRKTFSMGEARDKRFYLEAKKIK